MRHFSRRSFSRLDWLLTSRKARNLSSKILAGLLESGDGTFKAFQKLNANEADEAALTANFKIAFFVHRADGIIQGMIRGQREQRFFLGERDFDLAEQMAVGFFD